MRLYITILFFVIVSIQAKAQYIYVKVSTAECIACSKNFQNLNNVDGLKFFVFGLRDKKDAGRIEKRTQQILNYNKLLFNNQLEQRLIKESGNGAYNIFVYDKNNQLALKLHYNDLTNDKVAAINTILNDQADATQNIGFRANNINYKHNFGLSYVSMEKSDTLLELDGEAFDYHLIRKNLNDIDTQIIDTMLARPHINALKSQIRMSTMDINHDGDMFIYASYPIGTPDFKKTSISKPCIIHWDTNGVVRNIFPVLGGPKSKSLITGCISGDSLLYLIVNTRDTLYAKDGKYIAKYSRQNNVYQFSEMLPLQLNTINQTLFQKDFISLFKSHYPYFASEFAYDIYNDKSKSFIRLLSDSAVQDVVNRCTIVFNNEKKDKAMTECHHNIFGLRSVRYNHQNKRLYVIYSYNNETLVNVYDDKNSKLNTHTFSEIYGSIDYSKHLYYVDLLNQTLVISNVESKKLRTVDLSILE